MYTTVVMTHVLIVLTSGAFFALRGIWMLQESALLTAKPVRILPHIIDTLLLLSGFWLVHLTGHALTSGWLATKLGLLVAYIVLGIFALRRGKTKTIRVATFALALMVFGFMLTVALTKNPLGYFG